MKPTTESKTKSKPTPKQTGGKAGGNESYSEELMPLTKIAQKSELPAVGEAKEFTLGDKVICVANVAGEYSAMDNVCLHHGGPLGQGMVEDGKVVCPWHGWQYDPKTGELGHNSNVRVAVYSLKIEGEEIFIEV